MRKAYEKKMVLLEKKNRKEITWLELEIPWVAPRTRGNSSFSFYFSSLKSWLFLLTRARESKKSKKNVSFFFLNYNWLWSFQEKNFFFFVSFFPFFLFFGMMNDGLILSDGECKLSITSWKWMKKRKTCHFLWEIFNLQSFSDII